MAYSEHCGVLRTAWSNVDEAWGSPVGGEGLRPELLSDVSLSAQRFSAFNSQVLQYAVHFLFVATDERGPGGIKADYRGGGLGGERCRGLALPLHVQEKKVVLQIDCLGSLSHILAFMYAVNVA